LLFVICIISFFVFHKKETFSNNQDEISLFNNMLEVHYQKIFPNNANRNSAGFRFFEYIYDNLGTTEELFDRYNKFYCAVSGSIVSPENTSNFDILKVKDMDNKCVIGKYYRCCTPCNCDIMKYARVINTKIAIPKNSQNYYYKNLLTIGDPCKNNNEFPEEVDSNIFRCSNNLLDMGYRVNNKELTKGEGRLIIGVLYPLDNNQDINNINLDKSISGCLSGTKRFLSRPDNLQYGMGDIFVKMALMNDSDSYSHTEQDFCK
jgi:hypothetical protein